jgi:hypothetical protein
MFIAGVSLLVQTFRRVKEPLMQSLVSALLSVRSVFFSLVFIEGPRRASVYAAHRMSGGDGRGR